MPHLFNRFWRNLFFMEKWFNIAAYQRCSILAHKYKSRRNEPSTFRMPGAVLLTKLIFLWILFRQNGLYVRSLIQDNFLSPWALSGLRWTWEHWLSHHRSKIARPVHSFDHRHIPAGGTQFCAFRLRVYRLRRSVADRSPRRKWHENNFAARTWSGDASCHVALCLVSSRDTRGDRRYDGDAGPVIVE